AMRQILVDHFRKRSAEKRGGGHVHTDYDVDHLPLGDRGETLLAVDEALERLSAKDERLGRVVEYKFFGGMTEPEIAEALSISVRSVSSDWRRARAWLSREIEAGLGAT
ncbi:MAG: RNA polymerase subunit sigma, partial [Acidobacteria bacterium]|nr:RNA polymerase subunit sigma [Acidobacteriota bacterium]